MKYIIRLLAAIPMLSTGIATFVFFVLAFGDAMYVLAAIESLFGYIMCIAHYESTVRSIAKFLKLMAEDALNE